MVLTAKADFLEYITCPKFKAVRETAANMMRGTSDINLSVQLISLK